MIAIPNMEKPKSCNKCPFTCEALQFFNGTDIPQSCPLIDIVTCKECIHKIQALSTGKGATWCELISGTFYEDFFCKCGERRSE